MTRIVLALLWVYRHSLTRYTPACGGTPSCSAYAVAAVRDRGAVTGLRLAAERVRRCGECR
jgi:putative component of membrane protein insertase Oxa1/YidC/SpoIIIJ protein YidD